MGLERGSNEGYYILLWWRSKWTTEEPLLLVVFTTVTGLLFPPEEIFSTDFFTTILYWFPSWFSIGTLSTGVLYTMGNRYTMGTLSPWEIGAFSIANGRSKTGFLSPIWTLYPRGTPTGWRSRIELGIRSIPRLGLRSTTGIGLYALTWGKPYSITWVELVANDGPETGGPAILGPTIVLLFDWFFKGLGALIPIGLWVCWIGRTSAKLAVSLLYLLALLLSYLLPLRLSSSITSTICLGTTFSDVLEAEIGRGGFPLALGGITCGFICGIGVCWWDKLLTTWDTCEIWIGWRGLGWGSVEMGETCIIGVGFVEWI